MTSRIALVVAAGRGRRFGDPVPKQYHWIGGEAVLARTVRSFLDHPAVSAVRVVIGPDDRPDHDTALADLAGDPRLLEPVTGGDSRQDSVRRGLESLAELAPDRVMIHDAARPLVPGALIDRMLAAVDRHPGAIPCLPVTDTLKRGADGAAGPVVRDTVDRNEYHRAQTPQTFRFADILDAHRRAWETGARDLTDDAAVAEAAGLSVALVEGDARTLKITTKADLDAITRLIADPEETEPLSDTLLVTRLGTGFDVHAFEPGDAVILCGVPVPHDRKLKGHSDADVGLHAITDALLGAMGLGDIGEHFPPTDERWRGADSAQFLAHAASLVAEAGGRIVNVDVTLICEAPKLKAHKPAMRARIAEILGLPEGRVGVKATTTEKLGFTGRGEGIAAQAAAAVAVPL